jgi:hypothetical protein
MLSEGCRYKARYQTWLLQLPGWLESLCPPNELPYTAAAAAAMLKGQINCRTLLLKLQHVQQLRSFT